jgi:sugar O-acyltransferase (sialic acid O-acetyltransferase NeuD family)
MKGLIIFGTKAFAEIAHYYFTHDSEYSVAAFTVDAAYLREATFKGLPVVPFEEVGRHFPPDEFAMFVAVGIAKVNKVRAEKTAEAEAKGYQLASFVSSKADVAADLQLGPNTMIMERAGIQPFVRIGRNTVIWSTSRIGFRTHIGQHCWITCAICGESVTIGDFSFVGLNATIAPFVSVGKSNFIGAGALILKDTNDFAVYKGHPSLPSRVRSNQLRRFVR